MDMPDTLGGLVLAFALESEQPGVRADVRRLVTVGVAPAASCVKRDIPGRRGNALPVNWNPGWCDVGRYPSALGRTGAIGGPAGYRAGRTRDRGAARPGRLDDQPRAAAQRAAQGRLPAGPRRGLLPRASPAAGDRGA